MSISSRVLKSSFFLLAIQVVQRSLGIVSTLILARLLTPESFGIVALVTIALQFFELLVETGNQQYIVQKEAVDKEDLNTAWSMDILIKSAIAVIVIACSPALARWFEEPDLTAALAVASLALPIRALKTPGIMRLAREINYRPLFQLTLWQKGLSFITVLTIAFIEPSYWAIIIGNLVSASILALGSYRVDDHRPHWTLSCFRQQWGFSQWLLLRGIVGFTRSQIDNLMVSKFFGTSQLGGYNLVREVSLLPALSAIIPMSEPLLAAIAEGKHSADVLAYRVRLSLGLMISVLTPLTVFMYLYPELIIHVLLGNQWGDYAHLLRPFSLFFLTFCLFALISDSIIAQGRVRMLFWFDVVSTLAIVAILYQWGTANLDDMAWLRGWLAVATTAALLVVLNNQTHFGLLRLAYLCLPAVLASNAAAWLVWQLPTTSSLALLELMVRGLLFVGLAVGLTTGFARLLLQHCEEWHQIKSLTIMTFRKSQSPGRM